MRVKEYSIPMVGFTRFLCCIQYVQMCTRMCTTYKPYMYTGMCVSSVREPPTKRMLLNVIMMRVVLLRYASATGVQTFASDGRARVWIMLCMEYTHTYLTYSNYAGSTGEREKE